MSDLRDELINDPIVRGYAGMTDAQVVVDINLANRSRNRTTMTGREVAAEVVNTAYDALTDAKKEQFLSLIASDDLDPFGLGANVIKDIFGGGSATVSALAAARVEAVSRAVELKLGNVREGTVTRARL